MMLTRQSTTRCTCIFQTVAWDGEAMYGCVCDSSWEVGLGAGQRQQAEYFGADCSQRESVAVICSASLSFASTNADSYIITNTITKKSRGHDYSCSHASPWIASRPVELLTFLACRVKFIKSTLFTSAGSRRYSGKRRSYVFSPPTQR